MLLFVGFYVIHRYWPLIVSFAPLCKQGYLHHLVAIVTFWCTSQNTFVLRVFCAVQPKCHTDNVAWLLDLSGNAQEEIWLPICVANLFQIFFLWVVWILCHERSVLAFFHMIVPCAFICRATYMVVLLDLTELHKWRPDFQSVCARQ